MRDIKRKKSVALTHKSMEYIIQTHHLTKKYGHKIAVNDANINIRPGEIYGLIGRNGAGKTTIMRMLSGLSRPTSGSYALFGKEGSALKAEMHNVGVLIEAPGIYPKMSAYDNLRVKAIAMGKDDKKYINDLLELVDLTDTGKKGAGSFSLGMRQRLGVALALIGDPKLIILDEPINGLDPQGIVEVRQMLSTLRDERGITIMISSHILDELGKLADSYGIINEGTMIDEFTNDELQKRSGSYTLLKTDDNQKALTVIRNMGMQDVSIDADGILCLRTAPDREHNVVRQLVESDIFVKEIRSEKFSLEDYYLEITKEGGENNNGKSAEDGLLEVKKV